MMPRQELDERFADWVDGRLTAQERQRLEAELAADPELAAAAERYRSFVLSLRSPVAVSRLPQDFAAKVMDALPDRGPLQPSGGGRFRILPYLASGLAAGLIVSLLLVIDGMQSRPASVESSARESATNAAPEAAPKAEEDAKDVDLPGSRSRYATRKLRAAAATPSTWVARETASPRDSEESRKQAAAEAKGGGSKGDGRVPKPSAPAGVPRLGGGRVPGTGEKAGPTSGLEKARGAAPGSGGGGGGGRASGARAAPARPDADDQTKDEVAKSKSPRDLGAFIPNPGPADKTAEHSVGAFKSEAPSAEGTRARLEEPAKKNELGDVLLTLRLDPAMQPLPWADARKVSNERDVGGVSGFTRRTLGEPNAPGIVAGVTSALPVDGLSWLSSQLEMQMVTGNRLPPDVAFLTWNPVEPTAGFMVSDFDARKLQDSRPTASAPAERVLRVQGDPDQVSYVVQRLSELARESKGSLDVGRRTDLPHPAPAAQAPGLPEQAAPGRSVAAGRAREAFEEGPTVVDQLENDAPNQRASTASRPGRASSRGRELMTIWIRLLVGR